MNASVMANAILTYSTESLCKLTSEPFECG